MARAAWPRYRSEKNAGGPTGSPRNRIRTRQWAIRVAKRADSRKGAPECKGVWDVGGGEVFPNAACVVSLVDRLVHNAEIIQIEGESYRLKEAKERSEKRRKQRAARKRKPRTKPGTDD